MFRGKRIIPALGGIAVEEELRKHRCCFTGHRPEKLTMSEDDAKAWLEKQIQAAVADGFVTFLTGMAMGVDLWAAEIVLRLKEENPDIHLIACTPWPGFAAKWKEPWKSMYYDTMKKADFKVNVSDHYHNGVFQKRNEYMVDRSSRVIALYNGTPGGTKNTIDYATSKGIEVVVSSTDYKPKPKKGDPPEADYPECLLTDIGLDRVFPDDRYIPLSEDQQAGLERALNLLRVPERIITDLFYHQKLSLDEIAGRMEHTVPWVQMHAARAVRKLRGEPQLSYIRNGFKDTELNLKLAAAEEMKKQLRTQWKKHPQMTEEDVVKFVFQGMLGVGHIVVSRDAALARLEEEYEEVRAGDSEPLTEKISPEWIRLNLRPAKARGMTVEDIANYVFESAQIQPLSFTRQNVYNFCVKQFPGPLMKAAAEKVLDENWLPSHSDPYREAYHPAYRVLCKDYKAFKKEEM